MTKFRLLCLGLLGCAILSIPFCYWLRLKVYEQTEQAARAAIERQLQFPQDRWFSSDELPESDTKSYMRGFEDGLRAAREMQQTPL